MAAGSGALPRGVADPASMAAPSAAITLRRTTFKKRPKVMLCLTTGTFYNGPLYKAWTEGDTKVPEVRLPPQRQPAKLIEERGEDAAQFWKFWDPSPCDIGRTTAHAAESGCTVDQSTGGPLHASRSATSASAQTSHTRLPGRREAGNGPSTCCISSPP